MYQYTKTFADLDPAVLKPSVSDGVNLKPSLVTKLYTGGTPTAANQVKSAWVYPDGRLREGAVNGFFDHIAESLRIPSPQVVMLGDAEDGSRTTDTTPELVFVVPDGYTLVGPIMLYDLANQSTTFGPFSVTGNQVNVTAELPLATYGVLGTPATDANGDPIEVAGLIVIEAVGAPALITDDGFAILLSDGSALLAGINEPATATPYGEQFLFGDGLTPYLRTNGNVIDRSTDGDVRPIQPGRALSFDGVDDDVTVTEVTHGTSASISLWVKANGSWGALGKSGAQYWIYRTSTRIFSRGGASGQVFVNHSQVNGKWTHYGIIRDGLNFSIYVDGVLIGNPVATTSFDGGFTNVASLGGSTYLDGEVVDVRLYDRAITETEMLGLYNGSAISGLPIYHFRFDEGDGSTAYDSSGNGNHGTISGATWVTDGGVPKSWQNDVGYSDGAGGVLVPRDESTPANDVLGNALQYTGRVPRDATVTAGDASGGWASGVSIRLDGGQPLAPWAVQAGVDNLILSHGDSIPDGYGLVNSAIAYQSIESRSGAAIVDRFGKFITLRN